MVRNWDYYTRQGIDLAHAASSFGFSVVKGGTRIGFSLARSVTSTAVGVTTSVLDVTGFSKRGSGASIDSAVSLFGHAVQTVLTIAETLTLAPIHLSEYITTTSLLAAHSSINVLSVIFPGGSDASFSLASFIGLVRREWDNPGVGNVPEARRFGIAQVGKAIVAWILLQGVTQRWNEERAFKYLKEIPVHDHQHQEAQQPKTPRPFLKKRSSRIRVTSDVIYPPSTPGPSGSGQYPRSTVTNLSELPSQIISADIGDPEERMTTTRSRASSIYLAKTRSHAANPSSPYASHRQSIASLKASSTASSSSTPGSTSGSVVGLSHTFGSGGLSSIYDHVPLPPSTPHSTRSLSQASTPTQLHIPLPTIFPGGGHHSQAHSHSHSYSYDAAASCDSSILGYPEIETDELKSTLRRLSKMVLAGYGGASLLFFGISPFALGSWGAGRGDGSSTRGSASTSESTSASSTSGVDTGLGSGLGLGDEPFSLAGEKKREEANLASAVDAAEAEAAGMADDEDIGVRRPVAGENLSWWDILLGKHDREIFEHSMLHDDTPAMGKSKGKEREREREKEKEKEKNKLKIKGSAVHAFGNEHLMPRFWVLTDHSRGQIVLVIRGTMSLNEIAVDLTCEAEPFEPASTPTTRLDEEDEDEYGDGDSSDSSPLGTKIPGQFVFPSKAKSASEAKGNGKDRGKEAETDLNEPTSPSHRDQNQHFVHGGMLRLARAMGDIGKPVHLAVMEALYHNPDYDLVLCGHSLGAGVAAILGMMWADPKTCLTVPASGMSVGRHVSVYCFGPPALTSAPLAALSSRLITSLVYGHDIVATLSVTSVRDLRNVALWLCEAEERGEGDGYSSVISRVWGWKGNATEQKGRGEMDEDWAWFIAMRKTLEANMQNSDMYPPGRVLWAVRDGDLHPSNRKYPDNSTNSKSKPKSTHKGNESKGKDTLRLFQVLDNEKVFGQIIFASNMLSSHMPHQYDRASHDLL